MTRHSLNLKAYLRPSSKYVMGPLGTGHESSLRVGPLLRPHYLDLPFEALFELGRPGSILSALADVLLADGGRALVDVTRLRLRTVVHALPLLKLLTLHAADLDETAAAGALPLMGRGLPTPPIWTMRIWRPHCRPRLPPGSTADPALPSQPRSPSPALPLGEAGQQVFEQICGSEPLAVQQVPEDAVLADNMARHALEPLVLAARAPSIWARPRARARPPSSRARNPGCLRGVKSRSIDAVAPQAPDTASSGWILSLCRGSGLVRWGERVAWLVSRRRAGGVDGDVSSSSTAPILPAAPTPLVAPPSVHDSGADTAPGAIVVHSCTILGATLAVHLTGEIDHFSTAPLRAFLASEAAGGYTGLVLDTSRVTFCDSGSLAVLEWWPRHGRRLRLTNRSRAVMRLLHAAASAQQPTRPAALRVATS